MKRSRSALPLPRYVVRKPLKGGWGHFFNVPTWARKAGCPLKNEPLGTDYDEAVKRAETVLLPAFDSWRSGGATDAKVIGAIFGTLDWMFAEYRRRPPLHQARSEDATQPRDRLQDWSATTCSRTAAALAISASRRSRPP